MMDAKLIDDNNALSYHLRFFKDARTKELEEKSQSRGKVELPDNFDSKFMEDYFKEWLLFVHSCCDGGNVLEIGDGALICYVL